MSDRQLDEMFRAALDERADALLVLSHGEAPMAERLATVVARSRVQRQVTMVLLAAALLLSAVIGAAAIGALVRNGPFKLPVSDVVASPSEDVETASPSVGPVATVPSDQLTVPGSLTVCDDLSQPPRAFLDAQNNPSGADVDLFDEIAGRLGLQLEIVNARFAGNGSDQKVATSDGTCDIIVWDESEPLPANAYTWADRIRFLMLAGGSDFEAMNIPVEKQGLTDAVDAALLSLADDGTYLQILQGWNLQKGQLCPEDMQPNAGFPVGACLLPATPTPRPTPSILPLSASSWHQVEPNPIGDLVGPYGMAWSGSRFVVAGGVPGAGFYNQPNTHFWTSPDGESWSLGQGTSTGYPQAFAFDGNAGVAVGSDGSQAGVWTSADSQTWTRLANGPALSLSGQEVGLQFWDVAHGPAGYVATGVLAIQQDPGTTIGRAIVVWSADGRAWQRVPMGAFGDTQFTELRDVVVIGNRYVISGAQAGASNVHGPALWTSTDGRTWTREPSIVGGPATFIDLVAGSQGALLAGLNNGPAGQSCELWASSDGLAWTQVGSCPDGLGRPGLVGTPFGFAATVQLVGSSCADVCPTPKQFPCAGGVEVSVTGAWWPCVPADPSGAMPFADIVMASQNRIVAIGQGVWVADITKNP